MKARLAKPPGLIRRRSQAIFGGIFAALLWAPAAFAEDRTSELEPGTLSYRLGITEPSIPLELDAKQAGLSDIKYEQNPAPKLGIGADYSFVGFNVNFLNLEPNNLTEDYGTTHYFDLQFHINFEHFLFDVYYQNFRGYYFTDSSGQIAQRPDLKAQYEGLNAIYVFHPERVSFAAAQSCNAYQNESGGSWMLMAAFGDQRLSSNAVLAPAGSELLYGRLGNLQHGNFQLASLGGGYAYNWVFAHNWLLHGGLLLSMGPQFQHYVTEDLGTTSHVAFSFKTNGRFSIAYNGHKFFSGIAVIVDSTTYDVDDKTLLFNSTSASFFIGMRTDIGGMGF